MAYLDKLLSDREQVLVRTHRHDVGLLLGAGSALGLWLLALICFLFALAATIGTTTLSPFGLALGGGGLLVVGLFVLFVRSLILAASPDDTAGRETKPLARRLDRRLVLAGLVLLPLFGLALLAAAIPAAVGALPLPPAPLFAFGALLTALGSLLFVSRLIAYRSTEYVLTNWRVLRVEGVLNKRSSDSALEKINDAVLTQGVAGRLFNYGTLEILTAADSAEAIEILDYLPAPGAFKIAVLDAKHRLALGG